MKFLLALVLSLSLAAPAQASSIINLGDMIPNAINGHRQIVGDSVDPANDDAPPHAVVWNSGVLTRLRETAGATQSDALAINGNGRIVGDSYGPGNNLHALYWDGLTGAPQQLGPLSPPPDDFGYAVGVDNVGDVVGNSLTSNYIPFGFFSPIGSGLEKVGDADRGGGSVAVHGITPDGSKILGHVNGDADHQSNTGWYLWSDPSSSGIKLDLKLFQTGASILGAAYTPQYNNLLASDGTVLGYTGESANGGTYYLRLPNGSETLVNGLIGHNAVNAKHTVAGTILSDYMGQPVPHAAIWKPGGQVIDLNSLLGPNSDYILYDALVINDNGDIAGLAGQISTQKSVGFLLPAGYVVDSTGDQADSTPGDGNCLTAAGTCTLRAVLQEVNGDKFSTPTAVTFSATGTITPASALPAVQYPIALDGATKVTLSGQGLTLQGDGSSVRGMEIDNVQAAAVRIAASNVTIGALPTDVPPCVFPCNTFKGNGAAIAVASGKGNLFTGNRMTANTLAIDLGADGRTANDAGDVDTGANGKHNFPIGVLSELDPVAKKRLISGINPAADAGQSVDVYAQSAVTAARGAEPTDYVGTVQVEDMGGWVLDLPPGLPAGDTFFSAVVNDQTDGTSELSPICGDPDGDHNPDSDGDGLCDDWEANGIDGDGDGKADITLPGASPQHKDLYLEMDSMANGAGTNQPVAGATDDVVAAFAAAPVENAAGGSGIALHVNATVGDTIPEVQDFSVAGTGPGSLQYLRDGSRTAPCDGAFGSHDDRAASDCYQRLTARALAYRWVLFGHSYAEESGSSGFSSGIGGNTLTVTLGKWSDANVIWGGGGVSRCPSIDVCRRVIDAGTLMHEFGHSLGLHHGGRDDENYKPNYLSVMNYLFQMKGRVADRPLDYSRYALPALNENALVDTAGVDGGVDLITRGRLNLFWPHTAFYRWNGFTCELHGANTDGAIDWDSAVPTLSSSLLVHDKTCGAEATQRTLTSTEDWPDLRYSFRDQQGARDTPVYAGDTARHEETNTALMIEAAHNDVDGNGVNDLADACRLVAGSNFPDANGNGFADGCEEELTRQQAFPQQPHGSGAPGPAPAPAKDTTAPALSKLSARAAKKKGKPATLSFKLTEASAVTFTTEQAVKGHKKGKKCLASAKKGKKCTLYKKVTGTLRVNGKLGTNTASFATKKLKKGTYRLTAVAIDIAGNKSKPLTVTLTVR